VFLTDISSFEVVLNDQSPGGRVFFRAREKKGFCAADVPERAVAGVLYAGKVLETWVAGASRVCKKRSERFVSIEKKLSPVKYTLIRCAGIGSLRDFSSAGVQANAVWRMAGGFKKKIARFTDGKIAAATKETHTADAIRNHNSLPTGKCRRIVRKTLRKIDNKTVFIVLSDNVFQPDKPESNIKKKWFCG
jgi:hypothetical protein